MRHRKPKYPQTGLWHCWWTCGLRCGELGEWREGDEVETKEGVPSAAGGRLSIPPPPPRLPRALLIAAYDDEFAEANDGGECCAAAERDVLFCGRGGLTSRSSPLCAAARFCRLSSSSFFFSSEAFLASAAAFAFFFAFSFSSRSRSRAAILVIATNSTWYLRPLRSNELAVGC